MTYPLKVIQACERTIAAYDRLIETGDASKWGMYGALCRLCNAASGDCGQCPLGADRDYGCIVDATDNRIQSYSLMRKALSGEDKGQIVKAAMARRTWLKRQFRAAGIKLGKSKGGS